MTAAPGGAIERYGVTPDIVCLAKAIGGGLSTAAIGGTQEVMDHITSGHYDQVGTFNGNPLAMAAAAAALTEVLTPDTYQRVGKLQQRMVEGVEQVLGPDRPARPRGRGRGQGLRHLLPHPGPQLPRLPGHRRPLEPLPLALPAQRRRVPAPLGQGRAVAAVGPAHRTRTSTGSSTNFAAFADAVGG